MTVDTSCNLICNTKQIIDLHSESSSIRQHSYNTSCAGNFGQLDIELCQKRGDQKARINVPFHAIPREQHLRPALARPVLYI